MSIWQAIVLALLQGTTEFIPVSSSAHLVLVPWLAGWSEPSLTYDTVVHLGTLVAVLFYFRRELVQLIRGWWQSVRERRIATPEGRLAWLVILSAIPGAFLGYLAEDFFQKLFGSPPIVAALLILTGVILVFSERLGRRERSEANLRAKDALLIGVAQGIAVAPGISRSGATIATGLLRGLKRSDATHFSFLMLIPIVLGAAGLQVLKTAFAGVDPSETLNLLVGFGVALVTGYLAVRFLLNYVRSHSLRPFAYYCWAFGLLCLILAFAR